MPPKSREQEKLAYAVLGESARNTSMTKSAAKKILGHKKPKRKSKPKKR